MPSELTPQELDQLAEWAKWEISILDSEAYINDKSITVAYTHGRITAEGAFDLMRVVKEKIRCSSGLEYGRNFEHIVSVVATHIRNRNIDDLPNAVGEAILPMIGGK